MKNKGSNISREEFIEEQIGLIYYFWFTYGFCQLIRRMGDNPRTPFVLYVKPNESIAFGRAPSAMSWTDEDGTLHFNW